MTADVRADLFDLKASVLPPSARVAGFRGEEGLSRLYRFSIGVVTAERDEIDLSAARGIAATLDIRYGGNAPFRFHGMIAAAALRHAWHGRALYEITLVPKIWAMTLTHMSRVFVDKSVPDIIKDLFDESGMTTDDYVFKLAGDYAPRLHVCQYKESRWDFVARLMEREGLYYYFEQGDKAEKLVITDSKGFHDALRSDEARYVPLSGPEDAISSEALRKFTAEQTCLPASVFVRDFDYMNPTLNVSAEEDVWDRSPSDQNRYGDNFKTAEAGQRVAKTRAEVFKAAELIFRGVGRVFLLRPGYRFKVDEHPLPSMNLEVLATEVSHWGNQAAADDFARSLLDLPRDDYRVEVRAISSDVQFRPERATPVPRIYGLERGFVDGPAESPYAQIDEEGRYKVKIHFDIDDNDDWDGNASTWIRMLQPHSGVTEGFHFPLRKGTEVLIAFLGGDPDRPVIVGAVPNALQKAKVTRDNYTQNVIQTGSLNRFEIEDKQDHQYIDISTPPKDTRIHLGEPHGKHGAYIVFNTEGNQSVNIGADRSVSVGGSESVGVGADQSIDVASVRSVHVGGQQSHTVDGPVTETYNASHTTAVAATRLEQVGGDVTENYGGSRQTSVSSSDSLQIGAASTVQVGAVRSVSVGGPLVVNCTEYVSTAAILHAFKSVMASFEESASFTVKAGSATLSMASGKIVLDNGGGSTISLVGGVIAIRAGDTAIVTGTGNVNTSSGGSTNIHAGGVINATAANIKLNG